jgi:hypothetical protein
MCGYTPLFTGRAGHCRPQCPMPAPCGPQNVPREVWMRGGAPRVSRVLTTARLRGCDSCTFPGSLMGDWEGPTRAAHIGRLQLPDVYLPGRVHVSIVLLHYRTHPSTSTLHRGISSFFIHPIFAPSPLLHVRNAFRGNDRKCTAPFYAAPSATALSAFFLADRSPLGKRRIWQICHQRRAFSWQNRTDTRKPSVGYIKTTAWNWLRLWST